MDMEMAAGDRLSRRQRKKIQSHQAILAASIEEFRERGFKGASILRIMKKAELGTGTFYNYFDSKEDVLLQVISEFVDKLADKLEQQRSAGKTNLDLLYIGNSEMAIFLDENRYLLPLFLSASEHIPEDAKQKHEASRQMQGMGIGKTKNEEDAEHPRLHTPGFKPVYVSIIRDGQKAGEIRTDVPGVIIAEMFHSIFQAAAFSKLPIPFKENIQMKTRLIIDGIRVRD